MANRKSNGPIELSGQVAVVTGGGSGVGLAITRLLGERGCRVWIGSRSQQRVEQAAQQLRDEGLMVQAMACDVTSRDDVMALRDAALADTGRLDIWVNNAGRAGAFGPILATPEDDFLATRARAASGSATSHSVRTARRGPPARTRPAGSRTGRRRGHGGAGVDHQHGEARGVQVERDLPDGGVMAVDEQGVPGGGAERCGLVHAAGRGPGHLVLGAHAGGREPGAARVVGAEGPVVEELVEGQGDRGLEGRGGGEPGAQGHAGGDRRVEPAHGEALVAQDPGGPARVRDPAGRPARAEVVQRAGPRLARAEVRDQPDELVVAARQRHERAVGQRERQAEAAVVVEVLADQVHPAGCGPHAVGPAAVRGEEEFRGPPDALRVVPGGQEGKVVQHDPQANSPPVVGVVLGVLLLGETARRSEPAGAALVILGIAIVQGRLKRRHA